MSYYNKLPPWIYVGSKIGTNPESKSRQISDGWSWSWSGNIPWFEAWSSSGENTKIRSRTGIKKRSKTEANNS